MAGLVVMKGLREMDRGEMRWDGMRWRMVEMRREGRAVYHCTMISVNTLQSMDFEACLVQKGGLMLS